MDQVLLREDRPSDAGLRKKALALGSIIALVALVVGSFFGDRGILRMVAQRERTESLRLEIEELRAENGRLAGEIAALKSDPRAVEKLAREELGLARPGETVFLIHEPDSPR
ncbi:MAG TPA: septum formation initiator family protein [Vicinamibacteria bacterium]